MTDLPLAIYAGTFDPITNGHRDIVQRALHVFPRVRVAIASATQKSVLFPLEKRVSLVRDALKDFGTNVTVEGFDGLLVDYARKIKGSVIIRGLRAVSDYEYEAQMASLNRFLADDIETIFFLTTARSAFISSSMVKEVARNGGNVKELVPANVEEALRQCFVGAS